MDIYSAEIQINKLLNFVKGLSDSKSKMYQKSKDRLKELANTCNQVIVVISDILQDEALIVDENEEFGGSDTTDFNSVLNSMEDQISELRQFLNSPRPSESPISTTSAKKRALFAYKHCLSTLAHSNILVTEAEDCVQLIWNWFNRRFLEGPENFRYNMKKIPIWIRDIVILYGYHLENKTSGEFRSELESWIETISPDNRYAVPYDVYSMNKSPDPNKMTLSSVVLWDILLDYGLRDLCCDPSSELYPTEDCVYSRVGSLNSEVMNPYQNYMYDQSILAKCNLTVKAGGEIG